MIYITKERRYEIARYKASLTSASDLSYVLFGIARQGMDGEQHQISWYYEAFEKEVERYLRPQPSTEKFAIVLGALDTVSRELQRRFPQESMVARKAIELYADDFFYAKLVDVHNQLLRARGDV